MGVREDARRGGIDLTPWGKFDRGAWAVYPLLFHLLDVAALAGVVWDRYLTRGQRRLIADGLGLTLAEVMAILENGRGRSLPHLVGPLSEWGGWGAKSRS
ncbi:HD domain-containing protein [Streptomyces sp. DSM 41524]|uniref:HD domain-containing protein n=1 Tax=Streptomyces asiaticus subsp. ignotus TaxID=3098222 RepID=A0ABU7Q7Q6_9ACTN|nr:HD domain-containing protein [Streptomyces sp. DSM 41524]